MPTVVYHDARPEDLAFREFRNLPRDQRPTQQPPSHYGFDPEAPQVVLTVPTLRVRLYRSPVGQGEEHGTLLAMGPSAVIYRPEDDSPTAALMGPNRAIWAPYEELALDGPRTRVRPDASWLAHYLRTENLSRKVLQERQALVREAPDRWLEVADAVASGPDPLLRLRAFHQPAEGALYSCPLDLPIRQSQVQVVSGHALDPRHWLLPLKDEAAARLRHQAVATPEVAPLARRARSRAS